VPLRENGEEVHSFKKKKHPNKKTHLLSGPKNFVQSGILPANKIKYFPPPPSFPSTRDQCQDTGWSATCL